MSERWILVRESAPDRSRIPTGLRAPFDRPVVVGREGDIELGVAVHDGGISRQAVTVTATTEGWLIRTANRNGAVIHPWGLASYRAQKSQVVLWPLVGIRVSGTATDQQHWILLESDSYLDAEGNAVHELPGLTTSGPVPPALAPAELSALEGVFGEYLAWPPPTAPPVPLQLKQVASRLGKSLSGVQDRLQSAQEKALRLGLPRPTTLTHPDYFHVLVAAGYVKVATTRPYRYELVRRGATVER
ncbi:hypothetical protein [Pseudonocardia sp. TRM90224]|uniref:hypothetical protein n=1 Tax=Pseudonocardia sp. TRM90224 TaxID=2812678 RepID=UPI001E501C5D|nr:hypothetical protein [Pseudonocardia sp. TRM90224]